MFDDGKGRKTDSLVAKEYFEKAASKGNDIAWCSLSSLYIDGRTVGKDDEKAAEYLQKACDRNSDWGFLVILFSIKIYFQKNQIQKKYLGNLYRVGRGVKRDFKVAFELYHKSTQLGNDYAYLTLSNLYIDGVEVEKDLKMAIACLEKAAEMRNPIALHSLAARFVTSFFLVQNLLKITSLRYYEGDGLERNVQKASELLLQAISSGSQSSEVLLTELVSKHRVGWRKELHRHWNSRDLHVIRDKRLQSFTLDDQILSLLLTSKNKRHSTNETIKKMIVNGIALKIVKYLCELRWQKVDVDEEFICNKNIV